MVDAFNRQRTRGQVLRGEMGFDRGRGRGLGGGVGLGPSGECICPNCGYLEVHQPGVTCLNQKCPKCGALMRRAHRQ